MRNYKNKLIRALALIFLLSLLPLTIISVQVISQYLQHDESSISFFDFMSTYYDSDHINRLLKIVLAFIVIVAPIFVYKIYRSN